VRAGLAGPRSLAHSAPEKAREFLPPPPAFDDMAAPGLGGGPLPDTQNAAWKNDKGGFGYRMLAKMGWAEGKGLGRNEDGSTDHVRVKRRAEAAGLGNDVASSAVAASVTLAAAVSDFNSMLRSISKSGGGAGGSSAAAAGGGGASARAPAAAGGKRPRANSTSSRGSRASRGSAGGRAGGAAVGAPAGGRRASSTSSSSSSSSSSSDDGAAGARAPARVPADVKIMTRIGHHKVLRQKNVAAYSAHDLRAIFGHAALGPAPPAVAPAAVTSAVALLPAKPTIVAPPLRGARAAAAAGNDAAAKKAAEKAVKKERKAAKKEAKKAKKAAKRAKKDAKRAKKEAKKAGRSGGSGDDSDSGGSSSSGGE
jgi:hypothetical protein